MIVVKEIAIIIVVGAILLLLTTPLSAQNNDAIKEARTLAAKKEYDAGLLIVRNALERAPSDHDLLLMEIRLLAYKGDYDGARQRFNAIIDNWMSDAEALQVGSDVAYWSQRYDDLIKWSDKLLSIEPNNYDAHYKRSLAMFEKNELEQAKISVLKSLENNPNYDKAIVLRQRIDEAMLKNALTVSYRYSHFNKIFSPWHNASLAYTRNTITGPLTFRVNYGYQFDLSGIQYEADWYPRISKGSYGYLNAGFSGDDIFPEIRLGGEYFQVLPQAFEISVGARYLKYDFADVSVFTGSLSKYHKNYWISYRPTVTKIDNENAWTHTFYARKYLSERDHYLGFYTGYGNAPVQFVTLAEIQRLGSTRAGLEYQHKFTMNYLLKVSGEYQYEEYIESEFRNRLSIEINFQKRF